MISGPPLRLGINLDAMTVYLHKNGEIIESKEQKRGTLSIAVVIVVHPAAGGRGDPRRTNSEKMSYGAEAAIASRRGGFTGVWTTYSVFLTFLKLFSPSLIRDKGRQRGEQASSFSGKATYSHF